MDDHDLYRTHRDILESAIARTCRRFRLSAVDAEDFAGEFRLRLVREDYAILKQFEGRSSLQTYLCVVVMRAFQDWRNARWGKWRPSAEAKRLGPVAQRLETLVVRDRHTLDEAAEILRTNFGIEVPKASLEAMAARFPARPGRTFVAAETLDQQPATGAPPDSGLDRDEAEQAARIAARAIARALTRLPAPDQLILRMRFQDCLAVAEIARALHLEQKPLYKRIDRMLLELRRSLERDGLTQAMAAEAIAQGGFDNVSSADGEFAPRVRPLEGARSGAPGEVRVR